MDAISLSQDELCLHHLVERQARTAPEAIAVSYLSESLSYRVLDEWATRMARQLAQSGVGIGVPVGIVAHRRPATIVAVLAVLKAGGTYVPIDPTHPPERIAHVIADSRLELLLSLRGLALPSQEASLRVLWIDEPLLDASPLQQEGVRVMPDAPALIVYTSGSTGRPKGAVISHRAAVARTLRGYAYRRGDLQKFSLSVVAHLADVFRPLAAGGTIQFVPDEALRDPAAFAGLIASHGTTRAVFVPSHLQALLESGERHVAILQALDMIIVSGEAPAPALVKWVGAKLPRATLMNCYGLTETAGLVCMGPARDPDVLTVGHPLTGVELHVLDEQLEPIAPGQIGEIYLGGTQLATGYLHQPQSTAERFVANPFGGPGQRLYRTGDAGRVHGDGTLELCGRWDSQIKVRGFRVNPHEIESVLRQHPDVRDVVVVAQESRERELVACVFVNARELASASVRQFVAERLPAYMVPAHFARLDEVPLLPNGKVDRLRVARLVAERSLGSLETDKPRVAPRTATEKTVVQIWSEILESQDVGICDEFFESGGTSLSALRVLSRLEVIYATELTFQDLLDHSTPQAMSRMIDARRAMRESHCCE